MKESVFAEKVRLVGGAAYIVGGWVRDTLRGQKPKDKDYVVAGITEAVFQQEFPAAFRVGKSFPVYLLEIENCQAEVALARRERKCGSGYKGFSVQYSAEVTIEEDLCRRDTTMNSIAISLHNGATIDPYQGATDIENKIIRATSLHFLDDPVRALRAARQAAQTGFDVAPYTLEMMRKCYVELRQEPKERIVGELTKALLADNPSAFFRTLQSADLLEAIFPEFYALIGKTQPVEYHPEGDAFTHSLLVLNDTAALTGRAEVRFAALAHDIGKGLTKDVDLPHHYGHEKAGSRVLQAMNERLCLPKLWLSCAEFAIREHMRVPIMKKPAKIVDFLLALEKNPLGLDGFSAIVKADHGEVPKILSDAAAALAAIHEIKGSAAPASLAGSKIGEWVRQGQTEAYCRWLRQNTPS